MFFVAHGVTHVREGLHPIYQSILRYINILSTPNRSRNISSKYIKYTISGRVGVVTLYFPLASSLFLCV